MVGATDIPTTDDGEILVGDIVPISVAEPGEFAALDGEEVLAIG